MLERAGHRVRTWPGELPPPAPDLERELRSADAILAMVVDFISPEMLAGAPRLKVVANMAAGYDNVSPAAAAELGIWLTNTPGVLAETTADFAFALLLAVSRKVAEAERDTRAGGWKTWSPTAFLGPDVHGATLGIIGLGEIGEAMARRASGFSMRVLYTSRTSKPHLDEQLGLEEVPLETLLEESDFVSLHTPLTEQTRNLIGAPEFGLMKPSAMLINTARGTIVDQDALVEALRRGQIAGAALDVTVPEPLPLGHPLFSFPNVVITPHIASASLATRARMAEMAAANIIAVLEGREPINPVNRPERPRNLTHNR